MAELITTTDFLEIVVSVLIIIGIGVAVCCLCGFFYCVGGRFVRESIAVCVKALLINVDNVWQNFLLQLRAA